MIKDENIFLASSYFDLIPQCYYLFIVVISIALHKKGYCVRLSQSVSYHSSQSRTINAAACHSRLQCFRWGVPLSVLWRV